MVVHAVLKIVLQNTLPLENTWLECPFSGRLAWQMQKDPRPGASFPANEHPLGAIYLGAMIAQKVQSNFLARRSKRFLAVSGNF